MTFQIRTEILADLARGAAFLGTGGGGDPYIGHLIAREAIAQYGAPDVIDVEDLADDAVVMSIAGFGAPTVQIEKLIGGGEVELALATLEHHLGVKASAIMPAEIGGSNSMIPILLAAMRGLPLINADGMGRAFPELQMNTFSANGIRATPLSVVDEHGNFAIVSADSDKKAEAMTRALAISMGLRVFVGCFPMSGRQAKQSAVRSTLTAAYEIGVAIREGRAGKDVSQSLVECLNKGGLYKNARVLFDGKIVDLVRETTRGFSVGTCHLTDLSRSELDCTVIFQNENLAARIGGRLVAMVPDLICIIDRETGEPIPTQSLKYGQRVKVVAMSAPDQLRTPQALRLFGPAAFGIDEEYVPIENF
ncbi:DUF917 domain-containing protein [Sphingomonas crocodyli]|uniref:DUF917 domain-containing protein n=1 Tax=Sphingomonas crocodyli TaxID=1979270 RepID=A0A437M5R1_9SPHN|nr:DUF917 domain-containing protein [Sphingomonas crocodyli]RVT92979.1 DUF917 domain-containing protein [Sphingomonas crocodyli]